MIPLRYTLYIFVSALAGACGLILTEIAVRFFSVTALTIAFVSNAVGGVFLLAGPLRRGPRPLRGWPVTDWARLLTTAAATFGFAMVCLYRAIGLIGSSKSTLLGRLEVLFVVGLAVIFLGERWTLRHWAASVLALIGAVLVNFDPAALTLRFGVGELLTLLATFSFSVGIVVLKSLVDRQDSQLVTGLALLLGAGFLSPFVVHGGWTTQVPADAGTHAMWLVGSVLVVRGVLLGISWVTFNVAMRHIGASRCAVLFLTIVPFTVSLQVTVDALAPGLGLQVPTNLLTAVVGGVIICAGIVLLHRQR